MDVMLVSLGTAGDVHPFVGLGMALRARGHDVTLMVNEHFRPLADHCGFDFVEIGTADEYDEALQEPGLWEPLAGPKLLGKAICQAMPLQYEAIKARYNPDRTVLVASLGGVGARLAHEKLGVPLVSIVLQPATIRSVHRIPVVAGLPRIPDWTPLVAKKAVFRCLEPLLDRVFGICEVNDYRGRLGLPPIKSIVNDWWVSPQRVIALFPGWFGPRQPDWPSQVELVGFPMYDGQVGATPLCPEARSFLDEGDRPIVFTPGSGNVQAQHFFDAAIEACTLLARRGILLTRYPRQLPRRVPPNVRHFDFIPFGQLLPASAALVHHGGIGTMAQGLAAGIPQLIMPIAYDQPDNADRLKRLGGGDWLKPAAFRGPLVAEKLDRLLHSPDVADSCRVLAERMRGNNALQQSCTLIEQMLESPATSLPSNAGDLHGTARRTTA